MKRNAAIELLRVLLMFGICLCHSVGAGGHMFEPLRNVCMMCTVGFVFISGWFGIRLSAMRIAKLVGIALFAWVVVAGEDILLHGAVRQGPVDRMMAWWFLRSYLMLMVLSPVLNCIVTCLASAEPKVRRDAFIAVALLALAIYGAAWPMHCHWLPQIRVFLTVGSPCQPGTMCTVYLLARTLRVTGALDRIGWKIPAAGLALSVGLAVWTHKFSYYNSPVDFVFAASVFYFFYRKVSLPESRFANAVLLAAPSMFFIYLYHSHDDPGFVLLRRFQCGLVDGGVPVPVAWFATAIVIFALGLVLDAIRRVGVAGVSQGIRRVREGLLK